jgi:hypothetical protein
MLPVMFYKNVLSLGFLFYVGCAIAFGLSFTAGFLLLRRRLAGVRLSALLQGLQVLQVSTASFQFKYISGPQILLAFGKGRFAFSPGFYASLWIGPPLGNSPSYVGINLFAAIALWYLLARPISISKPVLATMQSEEVTSPEAQGES